MAVSWNLVIDPSSAYQCQMRGICTLYSSVDFGFVDKNVGISLPHSMTNHHNQLILDNLIEILCGSWLQKINQHVYANPV